MNNLFNKNVITYLIIKSKFFNLIDKYLNPEFASNIVY